MSTTSKSLLDSASVFLRESLRNYRASYLTFAILHVTTAVELLLKERLARIHPNLIFKSLDAEALDRSKTVGLRELPLRLLHLGVVVSPAEIATIREVAKWRNEIVHHTPTFDRNEAVAKLGEIYNFVGNFLVHRLGVELRSVIPPDLFSTAGELLEEWESVVAEASSRAAIAASESGGTVLGETCPSCGAASVLVQAPDGSVRCLLCEKQSLFSGTCPLCNQPAISDMEGFNQGEVYHEQCISDFGEDYMMMREEARRGR